MSNPQSLKSQMAEQNAKIDALTAALAAFVSAATANVPVPPVKTGPVNVAAPKAPKVKRAKVYANPAKATISINAERQGIELAFGGPIPPAASTALKANGWFFNPKSLAWYKKIRPYSAETAASYTASARTLVASLAA